MEAIAREGSYGWEDVSLPSKMRIPGPLKFGPFILGGNDPIYNLLLIDVRRRGVYLTFEEGASLTRGAKLRVVRPMGKQDDPLLSPGQLRRVIALVEIVEVGEAGRALVSVLSGSVLTGTGAEKTGGDVL